MDLDVVDPELLSQRTQPNPSQGVVPPADQPRGQALVGRDGNVPDRTGFGMVSDPVGIIYKRFRSD